MSEIVRERVAWARDGVQGHFVGALRAGGGGIRLTGREAAGGVYIALSIPADEIAGVRAVSTEACEPYVAIELVASEAIFVRDLGADRLPVHVLARRLAAAVTYSARSRRPSPIA